METENKTPFLETKAGTWGVIIPVILLGIGLVFSGPILATLGAAFTAMVMTIGFGLAYGILGLIALIILNGLLPGGWLLLKYQVFVNNLRKSIIDENPLTILRIWKEKANKRMADLRANKDEVKKQELVVVKANNTFKNDFQQFQKEAKALNGQPDKIQDFNSACARMSTAASMVQKTNTQLETIHTQYLRVDSAVKDLESMYKDMEYEEKTLIIDYEVSGALDAVWTSIRRIFKGNNEEDQMREQAIESINNKYAERMGRVESAIDDCQGKMDEIKLAKEIKQSDGVAMFNQLMNIDVNHLSNSAQTLNEAVNNYETMMKKG